MQGALYVPYRREGLRLRRVAFKFNEGKGERECWGDDDREHRAALPERAHRGRVQMSAVRRGEDLAGLGVSSPHPWVLGEPAEVGAVLEADHSYQ